MADAAIRIRGLFKIFGPDGKTFVEAVRAGVTKGELQASHRHVLGLKDIDLDVPAGAVQVVMGLSGSGKSTLVRHINRLIEPTEGDIRVAGEDVLAMTPRRLRAFRRSTVSMVFQRFALLPHKTVIDNVTYGLAILGLSKPRQRERAMRWIERVGLAGYETSYPAQLSGGMQQRVGLARALATDADILLMDEPFSALDPLIRTDMQAVLLDLQAELKKTIVFITHDLDEALRLGERIAILRDGEIVQEGTGQDIVLKPADDYISAFVREVNRGRVIRVEAIMGPPGGDPAPDSLPVAGNATLEEAARRMSERGVTRAHVVDTSGAAVGTLTADGLLAGMVTPA